MANLTHWTDRSIEDFSYQISSSFVRQIELYMASSTNIKTQKALADHIGVSPARVSQMFNNPGNLTLKRCVEYARALGKKVALIAYDDGDDPNNNGPVDGQVFERCWSMAGRPADFFAIDDATKVYNFVIAPGQSISIQRRVTPAFTQVNSLTTGYGYSTIASNEGKALKPPVGASNNA